MTYMIRHIICLCWIFPGYWKWSPIVCLFRSYNKDLESWKSFFSVRSKVVIFSFFIKDKWQKYVLVSCHQVLKWPIVRLSYTQNIFVEGRYMYWTLPRGCVLSHKRVSAVELIEYKENYSKNATYLGK